MELIDLVSCVRRQALDLLSQTLNLFVKCRDLSIKLQFLVFGLASGGLEGVFELGNLVLEVVVLSDLIVKLLL